VIKQCFIILSMFFLGNVIAETLHLPIPGNVLGFALLFAALCGKVVKLHQVEKVSDHITGNLALFFVVPIVGIMVHKDLIKDQFAYIFIPLAVSILIGFFTAAKVTELLIRREGKKLTTAERAKNGDRDDQ
ncbi:MAG TPA: CidA/LrgA family protein, partial [Anaerovoracaceae bacterium]|nr:CidA/LrgA family protein [Anaerovoracaceae bacterium]